MKAALKRLVSSPTTTIVLLLVYGAGLAAATFIEKYQGVEIARSVVYCSPLFFFLQFFVGGQLAGCRCQTTFIEKA